MDYRENLGIGVQRPWTFPASRTTVGAVKTWKIVVEKHPDAYVAYSLGVKGIVVGEGDSYETTLADCQSAIRFNMETFGAEALEADPPVLDAFLGEANA